MSKLRFEDDENELLDCVKYVPDLVSLGFVELETSLLEKLYDLLEENNLIKEFKLTYFSQRNESLMELGKAQFRLISKLSNLESLHIPQNFGLTALEILKLLPNLRNFDFSIVGTFDHSFFEELSKFDNIDNISLNSTTIKLNGLSDSVQMKYLKNVVLTWCMIDISLFDHLPNLQSVEMIGCNFNYKNSGTIPDNISENLHGQVFENLKRLKFKISYPDTTSFIVTQYFINRSPNLEKLNFGHTNNFNMIELFTKCPKIIEIKYNIANELNEFSGENMKNSFILVPKLKKLSIIGLRRSYYFDIFDIFEHITSLEELTIEGPIKFWDIIVIAKRNKNLNKLELESLRDWIIDVSVSGIEELLNCSPSLKIFSLWNREKFINDSKVYHLGDLKNLKSFHIPYMKIVIDKISPEMKVLKVDTDNFDFLRYSKSMKILNVSFNDPSGLDSFFNNIGYIYKLKALDLSVKNFYLRDQDVVKIVTMLPNLEILFVSGNMNINNSNFNDEDTGNEGMTDKEIIIKLDHPKLFSMSCSGVCGIKNKQRTFLNSIPWNPNINKYKSDFIRDKIETFIFCFYFNKKEGDMHQVPREIMYLLFEYIGVLGEHDILLPNIN